MTYDEIYSSAAEFISSKLLDGTDDVQIDEETPLLEWGVLNSLNTTRLLAFLDERFGVAVPPAMITGRHLRNLKAITEMVLSLAPVQA